MTRRELLLLGSKLPLSKSFLARNSPLAVQGGIKAPPVNKNVPTGLPGSHRAYADAQDHRSTPPSKPKSAVCHDSLGQAQGEKADPGRIIVRITSYRTRLLDIDNLCPKYFVDGLRYAKLIPGDRPDQISLEVSQVKCKKDQERTEIEVIQP